MAAPASSLLLRGEMWTINKWCVNSSERVDGKASSWKRGGVFACVDVSVSQPLVIKIVPLAEQQQAQEEYTNTYTLEEWNLSCNQLLRWTQAYREHPSDVFSVATYHAHGVFERESELFGYCVMQRVGQVDAYQFLQAHLVDTQQEANVWAHALIEMLKFIHLHGAPHLVMESDAPSFPLLVHPHTYASCSHNSKQRGYLELPRMSLAHGRICKHTGSPNEWGVMPYKRHLMYQLLCCILGENAGYALFQTQAHYETIVERDVHAFAAKYFSTSNRNHVHIALALLWLYIEDGAYNQLIQALSSLGHTVAQLQTWQQSIHLKTRYLMDWIDVLPPDCITIQTRVGIDAVWRIYTDTLADSTRYGSYGRVFDCCLESEHVATGGIRNNDCKFVCKVSPHPSQHVSIEQDNSLRSISAVIERIEYVRAQFGDQYDIDGRYLSCVVPRVPLPQWYVGDLVFLIMSRVPSPTETCTSYMQGHVDGKKAALHMAIGLHYVFWFLEAAGVVHDDLNEDNLLIVMDGSDTPRIVVVDFDRHTRHPGMGEVGYVCGKLCAHSLVSWLSEMARVYHNAKQTPLTICQAFVGETSVMRPLLLSFWSKMKGTPDQFANWYTGLRS
jgi:hypothetical protein